MYKLIQINEYCSAIEDKYFMNSEGDIFVRKNDPFIVKDGKTTYISKRLIKKGDKAPHWYTDDLCFYKKWIYRKLRPWNDNRPIIRLDMRNGERVVFSVADLTKMVFGGLA